MPLLGFHVRHCIIFYCNIETWDYSSLGRRCQHIIYEPDSESSKLTVNLRDLPLSEIRWLGLGGKGRFSCSFKSLVNRN